MSSNNSEKRFEEIPRKDTYKPRSKRAASSKPKTVTSGVTKLRRETRTPVPKKKTP